MIKATAVFKDIKSKNRVPTIAFDGDNRNIVSLINVEGKVQGAKNCAYTRDENGESTTCPVMKIRDTENKKISLNIWLAIM